MKYQQAKMILINSKPCPDGKSIPACASCAADLIARIDANKCMYCQNARITRAVELFYENGGDLMHLLCEHCAEALHQERVTFIRLEDQI